MAIKTATQLGFDAINGIVQDRRLARQILSLTAFRIQFSEGFIELMAPNMKERALLEKFVFHADLKDLGHRLLQIHLEKIILGIILDIYQTEILKQSIPKDNFKVLVDCLHLDLMLQIQHEKTESDSSSVSDDQFVIIATEAEVNIEAGALMVAQHEQKMLSIQSPMNYLASPEGQQKFKAFIEEKLMQTVQDLVDLPRISDPTLFAEKLRSVSSMMRNNLKQDDFIQAATMNFDERPPESRRVIAEVLKHHGLNPTLLDNVAFLCSDRPAAVQIESINVLVRCLDKTVDQTETDLAAISLLKVFAEGAKVEVQVHALRALANNAQIILQRLPNFLERGRILDTVKTVLLENPTAFVEDAKRLLLHFGFFKRDLVVNSLLDELQNVSDSDVICVYLDLVEDLADNDHDKIQAFSKRWKLFETVQVTRPDLAEKIEKQFRAQVPNSLLNLFTIFPELSVEMKVYFVGVLDDIFAARIKQSDSDTCQLIAKEFYRWAVKDHEDVARAILLGHTVYCLRLDNNYLSRYWPCILRTLTWLQTQENFETRLLESEHLHWMEMVALLEKSRGLEMKMWLAKVAVQKACKLSLTSRTVSANLVEYQKSLTNLLLAINKMIVEMTLSHSELVTVFRFCQELVRSPLANEKFVNTMILEVQLAISGKSDNYKKLLIVLFTNLADSPLITARMVTECLRVFILTVEQDIPPLPESGPPAVPASVPELVEKAFAGMAAIINGGRLPDVAKFSLNRKLREWHSQRPKVMTGYIPGCQTTEVEDDFKSQLARLMDLIKATNIS